MSDRLERLGRAFERVRTEPGLGRNVIAIAAIILMGVGVGSYILDKQHYNPPWQDERLVWATFEDAVGVAPGRGQEVRISGVRVGDIRDYRIGDEGQAQLLLAFNKDSYGKPIYQNATMVLRPKSPLNEMYVEVAPGGPPAEPVPQEGELPAANTRSPIQIDQPIGHLDDKTRDALHALLSASDQALATAPQDLPEGLDATNAVMSNMRPVLEELNQRREHIRTLITSISQISHALGENDQQLVVLTDSLHTTLRSVSSESDALRAALARLPGLTDGLNKAGGAVSQLTKQLDPTLDNVRAASETMPEALSRVTGTVEKLDGTLGKAKPVAKKLRPVVRDLRPFVRDVGTALEDIDPLVEQLHPITQGLVPYLPDLKAFAYQTNSLTSLRDANGAILRGLATKVGPTTLPIEGLDELTPTQR